MTGPASKIAGKTRGRPFAPGNKLGRGRPAGSRNKATVALDAIMAEDGEAVVRKLVDAAKGGDMQAARLVLERICPVRKGRRIELALPKIDSTVDLGLALTVVTSAMAAGEITPDEAMTIGGVLDLHRKAIETDDLARQVEEIKAALADRGAGR